MSYLKHKDQSSECDSPLDNKVLPLTLHQISTYDTRPERVQENADESKETARKERYKGQAIPFYTESSPHCSSEWEFECIDSSVDEWSIKNEEEIEVYKELNMVQNWHKTDYNPDQESRAMGTIKEVSEEHITESTPRTSNLRNYDASYESTKARSTGAYFRSDIKFITNLNNMRD